MSSLTLTYDLNELPSSQHRAGLAGLVMMLEWLDRQPGERRGTARVVELSRCRAVVEFDEAGLGELFDAVYAASTEEVGQSKPRKSKDGAIVPPIRQETRSEVDKRGKPTTKTYYYYPLVVPRGGMLPELDPSAQGERGLWIKLWRDAVWTVLRGVPAQRRPYEARAGRASTDDATQAWQALGRPEQPDDLSSTYMLGAQASTADNVPMRDRNRYLFLLHFWPFAVMIYVPNVVDGKGDRDFHGYAVAIPDISDLETYVAEFPDMLRERDVEATSFRPRGSLVDVVDEVGLDVLRQIRAHLARRTGRSAIGDLVLGVDVVHLLKQDKVIRVLANIRIDPGPAVDEYDEIRGRYWDGRFRQARLRALLSELPWHSGFDRLFSTTAYEQTFGRDYFRRDAREAFKLEAQIMADESEDEVTTKTTEDMVYRVVGAYLGRKLEKHGLAWADVKDTPREKDYREKREKLAKDAFLAVRSRTGGDFVEYFAGTLCSIPQRMGEPAFRDLTHALLNDTDTVRTLTLLALSARA